MSAKDDRPTLEMRAALDQPISILRREVGALIGVGIAAHLLSSAPGLIALPFIDTAGMVGMDGSVDLTSMATLYGTGALGALLSLPGVLAVYAAVRARLDGEPVRVGAVVKEALTPALIAGLFVYVLLSMLGALAFFVGFFVVGATLVFIPLIMTHEGKGVGAALSRSWELANHKTPAGVAVGWMTLLVLVVWTVMQWLLGFVGALPVAVWTGVKTFQAMAEGGAPDPADIAAPWWLTAAVTLVILAFRAVLDLYPAIALTNLYRAAAASHDGTDLEAMVKGE